MNDHELGAALRRRILGDREGAVPTDGRRWQALVADLCGGEQSRLLPALRHLVSSAPFRRAVAESPPLADPSLAGALMAELAEVYAAPIVARLRAVVAGLFALPTVEPEPEPEPEPESESESERRPRRGPSGRPLGIQLLLALLAFGIGGLSAALVAGLHRSLVPLEPSPDGPAADLPPAAAPVAPPRWRAPEEHRPRPERASGEEEMGPPPDEGAGGRDATVPGAGEEGGEELPRDQREEETTLRLAEQRSIASVRRLYAALARQDAPRARRLHSDEVADQFDPAFFDRFASVGVTGLRVTGRRGERVFLEGVVTYVEADGSRQSETRSFVVDSGARPPRITNSAFGEVIPGR